MLEQLKQFVQESFEDQRLSRNESSVFRELLQEAQLDSRERALLRNHIFEQAEEVLRHPHAREVLSWLKDLVKAMDLADPAEERVSEALFFPSDESLRRLLEVLGGARRSLDVCVFTITDNRIADALVKAHKKGVEVRIITDDDKAMDRGSDIISLSDSGIPLAVDNQPDHMHHKFAVLDGELLINGSFNWTRSASTRNFENITFSNEPGLVRAFSEEFERLWKEFRG